MFSSATCKQCGHQIFSFDEDSLKNMIENHFMFSGHTGVISEASFLMDGV